MAELAVRTEDRWHPVAFATREPIRVGTTTLWAPARDELIALLHRFGRPKDLARATALANR